MFEYVSNVPDLSFFAGLTVAMYIVLRLYLIVRDMVIDKE